MEDEVFRDLTGMSEEKIQERAELAADLFSREEYEESGVMFTHLATLQPQVSHYWRGAAFSYFRLGQFDMAMTVLAAATLLEPDNPELYYYCGLCLARMDERDEALEAFEMAAHAASLDGVYAGIQRDSEEWIGRLR